MLELERAGMIHVSKTGGLPQKKQYLDEAKGVPLQNIWTDIEKVSGSQKVGYPTQKPLELYERIIRASSNPGDLVLDPFAGCATTCVAAERLGRKWIGVDIWPKTHKVTLDRLKRECWLATDLDNRPDLLAPAGVVELHKEPPKRTDVGTAAAPHLSTPKGLARAKRMPRDEAIKLLIERDGPKCRGCDRVFDSPRYFEVDHVVPRADRGSDDISNLQLLCGPCNNTKSHRYTLAGLREQNRKSGFMAA